MANKFSIETIFKGIDRMSAPVGRIQSRVSAMTGSLERGARRVSRGFDSVGTGVKRAAIPVLAATAMVTAGMTDVIKTGAEFQQSLVNASAKFPEGIRQGTAAFKGLGDAARKTGRETEYTASESAEALNFLAMAGFESVNAITALPRVVDLATASQTDLAAACDMATDAMGAFNLTSKDPLILAKNLDRVNDVMAKTATTSNTSLTALFEAMKEGGPIAIKAGADIETFSAMAGKLSNAGIKGSAAGTTLKNIFTRLAAPVPEAQRVLNRLKVPTVDKATGNLRDVVDIFRDLDKATAKLGTADKLSALETVFGKIPLAGVSALLSTGADEMDAYRKSIYGATGSAATMAAEMRNTLGGSFKSLSSAIESVKISIFSMNAGPLKEVVDRVTGWTRANEGLIATKIGGFLKMIIDNFDKIVTWAKRIGIAVGVFIVLSTILKAFVLVMTAVNMVMSMNPIGLIVLGVIALIVGIVMLVKHWNIVWGVIKGFFSAVPDWVYLLSMFVLGPVGLLISAAGAIIKHWEPIKQFFTDLWSSITNWAGAAWDRISPIISKIAPLFRGKHELSTTEQQVSAEPVLSSPYTAISKEIKENKQSAEITLKADKGTSATLTGGNLRGGFNLAQSGAF